MSDELPGNYQSNNDARIMREWEIRDHVGKLLTHLESLGLPEKQEKAIKDLIKQTTWRDLWNGGTIILRSKEADEFLQKAINIEYKLMENTAIAK